VKRAVVIGSRQLTKFLKWWIGEVKGALDDARAYLVPRWRRTIAFYVSRDCIEIRKGDAQSTAIEIPRSQLNVPDPPPLPGDILTGGRRVRVIVDPDMAFIHAFQMPLATLSHLDSAIALQKPKWLPMDSSLVLTDFEVVSIDNDSQSVWVDLAAVKRDEIHPIEDVVHRWGLEIDSVELGRPGSEPTRFKFRGSDGGVRRYAMSRAHFGLVVSAFMLFLGVAGVSVIQEVRAQRALERAFAETSSQAEAVLRQRQELLSRLETLSIISQSERAPTAAAVLADVTAHLNKDAWLTTFELKAQGLRFIGVSSDPAALVTGLSAASFIAEPQLRSSTSVAGGVGRERFEITAQVKVSAK